MNTGKHRDVVLLTINIQDLISMWWPNVSSLLLVVLTAIGAYVGFFVGKRNTRNDLEKKYDLSLTKTRIKHYKKLYAYLILLSSYPQPKLLTSEELTQLSETLSHWYHEEVGLFLSYEGRKGYGNLQQKIQEAISKPVENSQFKSQATLLNNVRVAAHKLRAILANDVRTRHQGILNNGKSKHIM